jgi:hypothetical protein
VRNRRAGAVGLARFNGDEFGTTDFLNGHKARRDRPSFDCARCDHKRGFAEKCDRAAIWPISSAHLEAREWNDLAARSLSILVFGNGGCYVFKNRK